MKIIGHILQSYFQQRVVNTLAITAALLIFVFVNAIVSRNVRAGWFLFLIALMIIAAVLGNHLRNVIAGSASDLLPNYRRYQIKAAGLILTIFLAWPVIITCYFGMPVLMTVAIFLFSACLVLWPVFLMAINAFLFSLGFLAAFWLLKDVEIFISNRDSFSLIAYLGAKTGYILPMLMIAISAIGLFLFVRLYLKTSDAHFAYEIDPSGVSSKSFDAAGAFTYKIAGKAISRSEKTDECQGSSFIHMIRLFQFCMFQPGLASNTVFPSINMLLFLVLFFLAIPGALLIKYNPTYYPMLICYIGAAMCSVDFLQHRSNMAAIYLHAPLPSRNSFVATMLLTYLYVMFKQLVAFGLLLVIIRIAFPFVSWTVLFQVLVLASILNILFVSISLLASNRVQSQYCAGYTIITMLTMLVVLPITQFLLSFGWLFVAGLAFVSDLIFWLALYKFSRTEMDFVGPEIPG